MKAIQPLHAFSLSLWRGNIMRGLLAGGTVCNAIFANIPWRG
ncbi:MAG: hypothetical protein ACYCS1_03520 [Gammaproteobacteria bacterium]